MFESIIVLLLASPLQDEPKQTAADALVPVHSEVVSLIVDVDLAFGETGIVERVTFMAGDQVKKGELLAELNSIDAELEMNRVEAELRMAQLKADNDLSIQLAEKAYGVTAAELDRALKANEEFSETVSASEIDRLKFARDEAKLQIEQARHDLEFSHMQVRLKQTELEIAKVKLQKRRLYAPFDGMIVDAEIQAGEWIQPDRPLCRIVQTSRVQVDGMVNETDGDVSVGQNVMLSLGAKQSGELEHFPGRVTFVDPEIDTVTGQYRISAVFENPDGKLRAGQRPTLVIRRAKSKTE